MRHTFVFASFKVVSLHFLNTADLFFDSFRVGKDIGKIQKKWLTKKRGLSIVGVSAKKQVVGNQEEKTIAINDSSMFENWIGKILRQRF